MKYLPLVWAGLWRKPAPTIFTGFSVAVAFLLFGLLQGVNAGFTRAIANTHRESLIVNTKVRGGAPMPIASMNDILRIPGVREVAPRAYFMGTAGSDEENDFTAIATYPDVFLRVIPALSTSKASLAAMRSIRSGLLLTRPLMDHFGWKIGATVPVQSVAAKVDGSKTWTFQIVGVIDTPQATNPAYFGVINYDYFNDSRIQDRNTAEVFYVRIADPTRATATGAAIDRIFANSSHETHTRSQQERAELQARQMGDVSFFTNAIVVAVIFTLAFVTGNTVRQSLEQRLPEFAVLKSVGFTNRAVLAIAFAEALLLCVPPAAVGLAAAYLMAPLAREDIGLIAVSPAVVSAGLGCAALLALLSSALPATRLARMSVVAALAKR